MPSPIFLHKITNYSLQVRTYVLYLVSIQEISPKDLSIVLPQTVDVVVYFFRLDHGNMVYFFVKNMVCLNSKE